MSTTPVEAALTGYGRTVTPETNASAAARKLRDADVPLLVVEDDGIAGVVTESDFVSMVAEPTGAATVGDIMSTPPVTAEPMTPLSTVADEMVRHGVERVPVVDSEAHGASDGRPADDGTYWGFVSADSVAVHFASSPFDADRSALPTATDATTAAVTSD